ncbi:Hypothetical predicted protein [Lecanosticta acicola]|uniref:Uncharacterized protein n=1 Tax=Lecanosticta acicola TaxID=111012 RepID=A0AAI8YVV7_9PEZI|nr:Hypothetical predicted protein [Lecanosticta acicola]
MPFLTSSVRHALSAATLLTALVDAQQCYYPDGAPSEDTPCSDGEGASSCCGSGSFCMDNGLCFGGGLVSRGSCTDKSWKSEACTGYCKADFPSGSIPLMPCSSSTFVCGLSASCSNTTAVFSLSGTGSIVLRPSQVDSIVRPALSSLEASSNASSSLNTTALCAHTPGFYTSGAMAGLGCALGLPLLFCLLAIALSLHRRSQRAKPPKLMYKLPDDHDDFHSHSHFPRPLPPLDRSRTALSPLSPMPVSRNGSEWSLAMSSAGKESLAPPVHMQSFLERYQAMSEKANGGRTRVVELPGSPTVHELSDMKVKKKKIGGE